MRVLSIRAARVGALAAVFAAGAVGAQTTAGTQGVDTSAFFASGNRSHAGVVLPSARLLAPGQWELDLGVSHEGGAVRANLPNGSVRGTSFTSTAAWIDQRTVTSLQLTFSPLQRFEIYGALPVLLGQSGEEVAGALTPSGGSALGDTSVGARFAVLPSLNPGERGLLWTIEAGLGIPTGTEAAAFGDPAARFDAATSVTWESGQQWSATGHLGYRMGSTYQVADQLFGDQVLVGANGAWRQGPLQFNLDLISRTAISGATGTDSPAREGLEVLGGVRYLRELFFVDVGGGFAPLDAGPTPLWRVQASIGARGSFFSPPEVDPDPDHDGVRGSADQCPSVAEDLDGYQDEDGCPDLDNDADGVLDARDQCPSTPEDRDGVADEDGCPETDADADGVADEKDKCPLAAEDFDGFEDADGCPEPGSVDGSVAFRRLSLTEQAIYFDTGKATLDEAALAALRPIARSLLSETANIVLTGHADDQGTAERNDALSLQRAEAVKTALIEAGVKAERITTRGTGQHEPVSRAAGFGRSLNRSVTFEWAR